MTHRIWKPVLAALAFALAGSPPVRAQNSAANEISASDTGQVSARPDLGILVMEIAASAPVAAGAASQCARKASAVQAALAGLGYGSGSFELTPVIFSRAGGTYLGPDQPAFTGVMAQQIVYVFFEGSALADTNQLNQKIAATIDALAKAGAGPSTSYSQPTSSMVAFTVKDPATYETQALGKAVAGARQKAQALAKQLGVGSTYLRAAATRYLGGYAGSIIGAYGQVPINPLQGLPYRFYSARSDRVVITASATLTYDFR